MLRGLNAKGKLIHFKLDTKCKEIIQITAPWSSDQFWTFRPSQTGCLRVKLQPGVWGGKRGRRRWVWGGIKGLRLIVSIWKGANGSTIATRDLKSTGCPGARLYNGDPPSPFPAVRLPAAICGKRVALGERHLEERCGHPGRLNGAPIRGQWEKFTWMLLVTFLF